MKLIETTLALSDRGLFFQMLRRSDMRLLRGALLHLRDDRGSDWRQVTSLEVVDEHTIIVDHWLVVWLIPTYSKPRLSFDDFSSYRLHNEQDPTCLCEYCTPEVLNAEQQVNLAAFWQSASAHMDAVTAQSGPVQDDYCWMHAPDGWCCEQCTPKEQKHV